MTETFDPTTVPIKAAATVMMVRDGRDTMLSLKERYPDADPAGPLVLGRW